MPAIIPGTKRVRKSVRMWVVVVGRCPMLVGLAVSVDVGGVVSVVLVNVHFEWWGWLLGTSMSCRERGDLILKSGKVH